jgi:hypothetical protein
MVSLTLAPVEVALLDRLSAKLGLTKSALVGQLLRACDTDQRKKTKEV